MQCESMMSGVWSWNRKIHIFANECNSILHPVVFKLGCHCRDICPPFWWIVTHSSWHHVCKPKKPFLQKKELIEQRPNCLLTEVNLGVLGTIMPVSNIQIMKHSSVFWFFLLSKKNLEAGETRSRIQGAFISGAEISHECCLLRKALKWVVVQGSKQHPMIEIDQEWAGEMKQGCLLSFSSRKCRWLSLKWLPDQLAPLMWPILHKQHQFLWDWWRQQLPPSSLPTAQRSTHSLTHTCTAFCNSTNEMTASSLRLRPSFTVLVLYLLHYRYCILGPYNSFQITLIGLYLHRVGPTYSQ